MADKGLAKHFSQKESKIKLPIIGVELPGKSGRDDPGSYTYREYFAQKLRGYGVPRKEAADMAKRAQYEQKHRRPR